MPIRPSPPPVQWLVDSLERREQTSRALARRASARRHPLKSLAAFGSAARRRGMRDDLVAEIVERAVEILLEETPEGSAGPPQGAWLTVTQAARALGVTVAWIRDHLESPEGRRVLGYPALLAGRWRIPAAACSSEHRATFLATLPDSEPPENVRELAGG